MIYLLLLANCYICSFNCWGLLDRSKYFALRMIVWGRVRDSNASICQFLNFNTHLLECWERDLFYPTDRRPKPYSCSLPMRISSNIFENLLLYSEADLSFSYSLIIFWITLRIIASALHFTLSIHHCSRHNWLHWTIFEDFY